MKKFYDKFRRNSLPRSARSEDRRVQTPKRPFARPKPVAPVPEMKRSATDPSLEKLTNAQKHPTSTSSSTLTLSQAAPKINVSFMAKKERVFEQLKAVDGLRLAPSILLKNGIEGIDFFSPLSDDDMIRMHIPEEERRLLHLIIAHAQPLAAIHTPSSTPSVVTPPSQSPLPSPRHEQ